MIYLIQRHVDLTLVRLVRDVDDWHFESMFRGDEGSKFLSDLTDTFYFVIFVIEHVSFCHHKLDQRSRAAVRNSWVLIAFSCIILLTDSLD
jgi:hypothetical protein